MNGKGMLVTVTVDLSLTPDRVSGTVSAAGGAAREFDGWLGLAQAVASAAGGQGGGASIAGPALLGDGADDNRGTPRAADGR